MDPPEDRGMRLIVLFVGMAVVFLATWLIWGGSWDEQFTLEGTVAWMGGTKDWAWAAGIGLLVADLFLPMPGTVVMAALGYLYGPWIGGLLASVGGMLAGVAGYGVGRMFGENFSRRWLGEKDFERGQRVFEKGGGWIVAFSRALPILPEVISCLAGISRMPFGKFLVALACGSVPMGFTFAAIGASGNDAPWWAIGASLVVPGVLWLVAKRWQVGKSGD